MARNREFSQLGSFVVVDDNTGNIAITTSSTPLVGIGTTNPLYKLDVRGDVYVGGGLTVAQNINFLGSLFKDGEEFNPGGGVGIGSTAFNPHSGIIDPRVGVGFTDINFVGAGLSVTGYGTTLVVDFNNLSLSVDATVPSLTLLTSSTTLIKNTSYAADTTSTSFTVTLPSNRQTGDFVELHDTESTWDINNLMAVSYTHLTLPTKRIV